MMLKVNVWRLPFCKVDCNTRKLQNISPVVWSYKAHYAFKVGIDHYQKALRVQCGWQCWETRYVNKKLWKFVDWSLRCLADWILTVDCLNSWTEPFKLEAMADCWMSMTLPTPENWAPTFQQTLERIMPSTCTNSCAWIPSVFSWK